MLIIDALLLAVIAITLLLFGLLGIKAPSLASHILPFLAGIPQVLRWVITIIKAIFDENLQSSSRLRISFFKALFVDEPIATDAKTGYFKSWVGLMIFMGVGASLSEWIYLFDEITVFGFLSNFLIGMVYFLVADIFQQIALGFVTWRSLK